MERDKRMTSLRETTASCSLKTSLHCAEEGLVFESSSDTLLVVELFIDCMKRGSHKLNILLRRENPLTSMFTLM
jgi:hypothetical protein